MGRVVLVPTGTPGVFDIAFSAGPHPVREAIASPDGALAAFCDVLAP